MDKDFIGFKRVLDPRSRVAKWALYIVLAALQGCGHDKWFLLPDRQQIRFACDMDPLKQGCERDEDYRQHFKTIKKANIGQT